jgi:hypothetical protein
MIVEITDEEAAALHKLILGAHELPIAEGEGTSFFENIGTVGGKIVNARAGRLPDGRIDFSDAAEPAKSAGLSFEFMIPAPGLDDSPELFRAQINGETARRVLREALDLMLKFEPDNETQAAQWTGMRAALIADLGLSDVAQAALELFTESLREVSKFAVTVAVGYSLGWALIPVLERSAGNAARADFVQGMIGTNFEVLIAHVEHLRSAIEKALDSRVAELIELKEVVK